MRKRWTLLASLTVVCALLSGCDQPTGENVMAEAEQAVAQELEKIQAEDEKDESTETPSEAVDAKVVLSDAIAAAKAQDKVVFVYFSADW